MGQNNLAVLMAGFIHFSRTTRDIISQIVQKCTFPVHAGFSLRILVAGERCNLTGQYYKRGSTSA